MVPCFPTSSATLCSTHDGRISPAPDGAVMLGGYAAKFPVILGLFRFREHSIARSTIRRWDERFPTIV
jgi:hypothetical protein